MARKKPVQFESALDELESIVEVLEQGELSLEDSLKAFEQGIKLTRECQHALKDAEQKVQLLIESNGAFVAKDFPQSDRDSDQ